MTRNVTVSEAVGAHLRRHREQHGLTQDHVARAAQRLGLKWGRSSVAMLELGQRKLSAEELLALPWVLDEALRVSMPGAEIAEQVSLDELLTPPAKMTLALTEQLQLRAKQVTEWLGSTYPPVEPKVLEDFVGEAEHKAARALAIDVDDLVDAAFDLWGHSLTAERDRRANEHVTDAASLKNVPAVKGHVTRELLDELRTVFDTKGRTDGSH